MLWNTTSSTYTSERKSSGLIMKHIGSSYQKNRLRILMVIGLIIFSFCHRSFAQVYFHPQVQLSASLEMGTQIHALEIQLKTLGLLSWKGMVLEPGASITWKWFSRYYGDKSDGSILILEAYGIFGFSRNDRLTPLYAGESSLNNYFSTNPFSTQNALDSLLLRSFSGIGFGVNKKQISGRLKNLENRRGIFLVRVHRPNGVGVVRIMNDFKAGLLMGGGTDQGETGSVHIGYSFQGSNARLHSFGLTLGLITPQPNYYQNPTNTINSSDESKPVLYAKERNQHLFHGNIFGTYNLTTPYYSQQFDLGIDSQNWGGKLQNMLHDSFGLYPRFGWNRSAKNKWYFQSKTSGAIGM